jgi:hypothetical protein
MIECFALIRSIVLRIARFTHSLITSLQFFFSRKLTDDDRGDES